MKQINLVAAIGEMAQTEGGLEPEQAIYEISALMDRLDPTSDCYWETMQTLAKVGATVWNLARWDGADGTP